MDDLPILVTCRSGTLAMNITCDNILSWHTVIRYM